jgi:hypothetical protein
MIEVLDSISPNLLCLTHTCIHFVTIQEEIKLIKEYTGTTLNEAWNRFSCLLWGACNSPLLTQMT